MVKIEIARVKTERLGMRREWSEGGVGRVDMGRVEWEVWRVKIVSVRNGQYGE